jgi:hypothetical protein
MTVEQPPQTTTEARWQALEALRNLNPVNPLIIEIEKQIDGYIADRRRVGEAERLWGMRARLIEEVEEIRRNDGRL